MLCSSVTVEIFFIESIIVDEGMEYNVELIISEYLGQN